MDNVPKYFVVDPAGLPLAGPFLYLTRANRAAENLKARYPECSVEMLQAVRVRYEIVVPVKGGSRVIAGPFDFRPTADEECKRLRAAGEPNPRVREVGGQ